jgi:hypothetical protein
MTVKIPTRTCWIWSMTEASSLDIRQWTIDYIRPRHQLMHLDDVLSHNYEFKSKRLNYTKQYEDIAPYLPYWRIEATWHLLFWVYRTEFCTTWKKLCRVAQYLLIRPSEWTNELSKRVESTFDSCSQEWCLKGRESKQPPFKTRVSYYQQFAEDECQNDKRLGKLMRCFPRDLSLPHSP